MTKLTTPQLTILVFSYNRGQFLSNCISSIERFAPDAHVVISDDMSTDVDTVETLAELAKRYKILQPTTDNDQHKAGGLYGNIQRAVDFLPNDSLFFCLQDDTQLVRKVEDSDLLFMNNYFEQNPDAGFLHHAFMKRRLQALYDKTNHYDSEKKVYQRIANGNKVGEYFSALFCSTTTRLREKNWRFEVGEPQNNKAASKVFERMGFMRDPLIAWLPCVPSHRHKRKTWAIRLAERRTGAGFYPFADLQGVELETLRERDPVTHFPIAETYLRTLKPTPIDTWIEHPLQGVPRWLYLAHRIESKLTRR